MVVSEAVPVTSGRLGVTVDEAGDGVGVGRECRPVR